MENKNNNKIDFLNKIKSKKILPPVAMGVALMVVFFAGYFGETSKSSVVDKLTINAAVESEETRVNKKLKNMFYEEDKYSIFDAKNQLDLICNAYPAVMTYDLDVSGKNIAKFASAEQATKVLDKIKVVPTGEFTNLKTKFKENVSVGKKMTVSYGFNGYDDVESAYNYIKTGQKKMVVYEVVKGDFLEKIALKFDITKKDILALNPQLSEMKYLQIGEELKVMKANPVINTLVSYEETYNEEINPEVLYEDSKRIYEGNQKVYAEGSPGQKVVVADVSFENGVEIAREIKSSEVTKEPENRIILVGTKPSPIALSSVQSRSASSRNLPGQLTLLSPVNGYVVTSPYGMRSGRFHTGIDLAVPTGTHIYAAESGTVIRSTNSGGGYGKYIIVKHSNGVSTLYAHCSSLLVSVGDTVSKGDVIARSGNTGRSTGPHLHFEVMINGETVNPSNYYSF